MDISDDEYYYGHYDFLYYRVYGKQSPPLIKTKSRMIAAVVHNQVEILRELMDSPKWYNVKDKFGYNLLQIAIMQHKTEIFDFIVSLPDFPLDFTNKFGETALQLTLGNSLSNHLSVSDHFAYKLLKSGVNIDLRNSEGDTPLHGAVRRSFARIVELLIDRNIDVNAINDNGETPLQIASYCDNSEDIMHLLLINGAVPSMDLFYRSLFCSPLYCTHELMFRCLFDMYCDLEVPVKILVKLAEIKSYLFDEILKCPIRIAIGEKRLQLFFDLCSISLYYLEQIMKYFGTDIIEAYNTSYESDGSYDKRLINLDSLNFLMESGLKRSLIQLLSSLDGYSFICMQDEDKITSLYCYLLSYGVVVKEPDLQKIYQTFGYCQLFKILLHMDILREHRAIQKEIIPELFYNIHLNVDYVIRTRNAYKCTSFETLCDFFVNPKLSEFLKQNYKLSERREHQVERQIPSLLELGRNLYRSYLIKSYSIKNSRQFYTRVNLLDINNIYKKIITYETKIY